MEKFNIQGKQTSFYKYCPATFGYILVFTLEMRKVHEELGYLNMRRLRVRQREPRV